VPQPPSAAHLLEVELLHAGLVRSDGGALDAYVVLLQEQGSRERSAAMHVAVPMWRACKIGGTVAHKQVGGMVGMPAA
jgi:hypothetical protein